MHLGYWDPYSVDESAKPEITEAMMRDGNFDRHIATYKVPGSDLEVRVEDIERTLKKISTDLNEQKPWQSFPDLKPDLTWWTPTCTSKDWKHKDVGFEVADGIAYVTFKRGSDNNAIIDSVVSALNDALFELHSRKGDIRVVVFTGEGKMYCSGEDRSGKTGNTIDLKKNTPEVDASLNELAKRAQEAGAFPENTEVDMKMLKLAKTFQVWAMLPQFSICLANGSAMGMGVGCACACDMTIAMKDSFFCVSEVRVGNVPALIAPYIIMKVGAGYAKRLMSTAENLSATEAKAMNLINEVVDNVKAGHELIKQVCEQVTQCGPETVDATKNYIYSVAGKPVNDNLMAYTCAILQRFVNSKEGQAGLAAFQADEPKPWEKSPIKPKY